jgi:hypothetical protein
LRKLFKQRSDKKVFFFFFFSYMNRPTKTGSPASNFINQKLG